MYKLLAVLICVFNCVLFANNNSLSGLINFKQNDRSLNSYETLLSHLKSLEQHNKSEAIKALIKHRKNGLNKLDKQRIYCFKIISGS